MPARSEFKYDLFKNDLPDIVKIIEGLYQEIIRQETSTLTLYFYQAEQGAPELDLSFRLRAYTNIVRRPTRLQDIRALPWWAETKCDDVKTRLGRISALPDGDEWMLFGDKRRPRSVKISQRRHFAIHEASDEASRITIDVSRSMFYIAGHELKHIGDMGPRIEVKLPQDACEDDFPLTNLLRAAGHWMAFGSLTNYSRHFLSNMFPSETHMSLPEIESKFAVTCESSERLFALLFDFLAAEENDWHLALPYPHIIVRTRRYHVCEGRGPGSTVTIVETASGRCSVKIKEKERPNGAVLLRATQASHTTDIDGKMMSAKDFAVAHGLIKINEFTKIQRKIPIVLANGHGFVFTVDHCTDPRRRMLTQLEIEYMGSSGGKVAHIEHVLSEIRDLGSALLASPIGLFLSSTHLTKHAFFAKVALPKMPVSAL
ncbi:hypothetical protein IF1G_05359 [Cordyceps javanica]|uniref:Uncharacterized protein n=1 Tax=Cordyceps javanica TaxID=43265 RepID=A0A545V1C6_9HYPO|nr:hypothetical protein IF1G_05359 [Cordyceps javanica]TQW07271.1 hypothetical protein IF2G_05655 [Cordyceps javanica]